MKTKVSPPPKIGEPPSASFGERYAEALSYHLTKGTKASLLPAHELGCDAVTSAVQTLELARMHDLAMSKIAAGKSSGKNSVEADKRAGFFFSDAIRPMEGMHPAAVEFRRVRDEQIVTLRARTQELLLSNHELKKEIAHRKVAEEALKKSEQHQKLLVAQSRQMEEQLRYLSHHILLEQEEQRREISRELHDEIAQILAGINVHLAALKAESTVNTKGLSRKITNTQKLVEKSVKIVHRFACQLRPTVLDDLGIIPALNTYMKDFTKRTGILIHFRAFSGVEQLNATKRTVLFRVAQAALANVAQHSKATLVRIAIKKLSDMIAMEIHDDGKSFEVERVLSAKMNEHLGLIGMRERVEMVGGNFSVESSPGNGTTICAEIPSRDSRKQRLVIRKKASVLV